MDYYERAGLTPYLDKLGFGLVGFGCTTCIGNSGPLLAGVPEAVAEGGLAVVSVLSGNRNFEGRINPDVRLNYLASPPLVVAYALAGSMDFDIANEPLGDGHRRGAGVPARHLAQLRGGGLGGRRGAGGRHVPKELCRGLRRRRALVRARRAPGRALRVGRRLDSMCAGLRISTACPRRRRPSGTYGAPALARLANSVTTDHISPAGNIRKDGPAGTWLIEHGVAPGDFNSYGARRGNHEVMVRGTFANVRLRNQLAPGTEGGLTTHFPTGEQTTIYDAAMRYIEAGTPLVVLAGKEYGSGSSRDWAAKGTALLGVRAVLAESFERIHRSNLIGMGVLPLQFLPGESAASLGLTGEEVFDITGLEGCADGPLPSRLLVRAGAVTFEVVLRIDTPVEADYYRHGGILPYVLRQTPAAVVRSGLTGGRRAQADRPGPKVPGRRAQAGGPGAGAEAPGSCRCWWAET